MSKKRKLAIFFCLIAMVLLNIFVFKFINIGTSESNVRLLNIVMESELEDTYKVYFSEDCKFYEEYAASYYYDDVGKKTEAEYEVPLTNEYLRVDFGSASGVVKIYEVFYEAPFKKIYLDLSIFDNILGTNGIKNITKEADYVMFETEGNDPHVVLQINNEQIISEANEHIEILNLILDIFLCLIIDIIFFIGIKYINKLVVLPVEVYRNRALIANLSKNDFKTRFSGSFLGIMWAFIQPTVTILVYWFVFEIGLKTGTVSNYPFILWFMAGLIPWFFFSEALAGGTNALIEYSYLVKKVVFKISILPAVKVISSIFVHLFFVAIIIILCWIYGYTPDLYSLQIIYYVFCTFVLVLGLSYLTSAIVCFFKDLGQVINILLQVGMWMTPIMWDSNILSPKLQFLFKLNPMYYVVDGFRNALLDKIWFWDKLLWSLYFWIVVVVLFAVGITIFKKLRIHFADVL